MLTQAESGSGLFGPRLRKTPKGLTAIMLGDDGSEWHQTIILPDEVLK